MSVRTVLEYNKKDIFDRIDRGESTNTIAEAYGCNSGSIWFFLKDNGIEPNHKRTLCYGNSTEYREQIEEMFLSGKSTYTISKVIGISKYTVRRWLNIWGYDTSDKRTGNPDNLLKDKTEQVVKLFSEGKNSNEIAHIVGHSRGNVWKLLKSLDLDSTDNSQYSVDETYFQKIDSQEKAYALGWWYSDGNVMPDGKIRVCIKEDDIEIVEWLKTQLKYEGPLYHKPARNTSKPQVELCINRMTLANQLINLGCTPHKSMTLKCPSYDIISQELFHHFIRGYFDGDGSVSKGYISITSTIDFLEELVQRVQFEYSGIYQRYKDRPRNESSHQLFICRKNDMVTFAKWLYKDATICLKRKHNLMKKWCIIC